MALARIISRSQQCSLELERELLARGYAVEIVSPDAIPGGLVDLELRVEADAADCLTATVEARNGAHSVSLGFVHRLQAPMGDFVRRPPQIGEKVFFPAEPVSFNAEPEVAEDVELPSKTWRPPEPALKLEILADPDEGESPIAPPQRLPAPARDLAKHLGRSVTIKFHRFSRLRKKRFPGQALRRAASQVAATVATRVPGTAATHLWERAAGQGRAGLQSCRTSCRRIAGVSRRGLLWTFDLFSTWAAKPRWARIASSAGWFGRPPVAVAAVLVVAIFVAWGISRHRTPSTLVRAPSTKDSQTSPGKTAAAPNVNSSANPEPEHAVAVPTAPGKAEAKPAPKSKMLKAGTKSKKLQSRRSLGKAEDDVVAHDTVVYFNRPTSVAPAKDSSLRGASSHKPSKDTTE